MEPSYNVASLQSLFGYGRAAHVRSGGICQLCGCGAGPAIDFDLWRQFTIEHLIGNDQGGYPKRITAAVETKFAHLPQPERRALAERIHEANIVTACQFCNSVTSRDRAPLTMEELIANAPFDVDEVLVVITEQLQRILEEKRTRVQWKLHSVYQAFHDEIEPALLKRREEEPALQRPREFPTTM